MMRIAERQRHGTAGLRRRLRPDTGAAARRAFTLAVRKG